MPDTTLQRLEAATSAAQFIASQIANAVSPMAAAATNFLLGQPALVTSLGDLAQKAENGTANWEDVIQPVLKAEGLLAAAGMLARVPGAQGAAIAVGAAAAALFVWQNRDIIISADDTVRSYFENRHAQLENWIRDQFGMSRIFEPPVIPFGVYSRYADARNFIPPRDPLVLDLDADGIEATAIDPSNPTLFDHDADGIQTATGWIRADDGLLVLDLNANGLIDTGRELFGDNTLLPDGARAANGYLALAQHDANADGRIDSTDPVFADLRIWQDANQDAISQAGELRSLAQAGILSINVVGSASTITLGNGNGNSQPWSGSFVRVDGSSGASGTPELWGSFLPASNGLCR